MLKIFVIFAWIFENIGCPPIGYVVNIRNYKPLITKRITWESVEVGCIFLPLHCSCLLFGLIHCMKPDCPPEMPGLAIVLQFYQVSLHFPTATCPYKENFA